MASPSTSEATNWDPMGANGPAGSALMVLCPENEAAKWAFSQVVDFIKEQHRTQTDEGDDSSDVRSHYAKFMWFSDEQIYDAAVSRYVHDRSILESSASSSSNVDEPATTLIWTGFYFLDTSIETLQPSKGWLLGRLSRKYVSFGQPAVDMALSASRASSVARRHAVISFSRETRLATVSLEFGNSIVVNATSLTSRGSVAGCPLAKNRIHVGDLMYSLEYTPYCRQNEGQMDLSDHLRSIHGNNQPTKEVLQATPTPQTTNAQTIGRYTITGGLTGLGAFGRVRPAVGPDGQKTVAIKTMDARPSRTRDTQRKIELMEHVSRLAKAETQRNVLTMIESIYVPGRQLNEFHIVLEPYIGFTLHEIPKDTHSTNHELILHDCLRGLAFLHAHDMVHTDIKPPNIGLVDFHRDGMHKPAELASDARPPRAVILDIDSMQQIPAGQSMIRARPGTNGTIGFHSPEHEMSEYDGNGHLGSGRQHLQSSLWRAAMVVRTRGQPMEGRRQTRSAEQVLLATCERPEQGSQSLPKSRR
ncbi:kinase-like domain-containing protein [Trichoderma gracile]